MFGVWTKTLAHIARAQCECAMCEEEKFSLQCPFRGLMVLDAEAKESNGRQPSLRGLFGR